MEDHQRSLSKSNTKFIHRSPPIAPTPCSSSTLARPSTLACPLPSATPCADNPTLHPASSFPSCGGAQGHAGAGGGLH